MGVLEHCSKPLGPRSRTAMNYLLPAEIICLIIKILIQDSYALNFHKKYRTSRLDIIHLSQVCRHWRESALGFKQAWTHILNLDTDDDNWIQELLWRSGNAPLKIETRMRSFPAPPFRFRSARWNTMFQRMDRIEEIDISLYDRDNIQDVGYLFNALGHIQSPILTALRLSFDEPGVPFYRLQKQFFLPRTGLFQGSAPNLRCLVLNYLAVTDLSMMESLNLTHLEVSSTYIQLTPWLKFLSTQHNLEHLNFITLDPMSRRLGEVITDQTPSPLLRKLKSFTVRHNVQHTANILGYLVLPTSSDIRITWRTSPKGFYIDPMGSVSPLFRGLEHRFREWASEARSKQNPRFFWEIAIVEDEVDIRISPCDEYGQPVGSCLGISFHWESDELFDSSLGHFDLHIHIIGPLLLDLVMRSCTPILQFPTVVSVRSFYPLRTDTHMYLMNSMSSLLSLLSTSARILILSGNYIDCFIKDFLHGKTPALFPNLNKIIFAGDLGSNLSEGQVEIKETFVEYLRWRSQPSACGKRIPELELIPYDLDDVDEYDPDSDGFPLSQNDQYSVCQQIELQVDQGPPTLNFNHLKCTSCRYSDL